MLLVLSPYYFRVQLFLAEAENFSCYTHWDHMEAINDTEVILKPYDEFMRLLLSEKIRLKRMKSGNCCLNEYSRGFTLNTIIFNCELIC